MVKSIKNAVADKAILLILAAGFGTRLEPRTLTIPKQLLPIAGGVVMDLFYRSIESVLPRFSKKVLITNAVYYPHFKKWVSDRDVEIEVISNKVKNKADKIGAIGDLLKAIKEADIKGNIFVAAPDYILKNIDFNDVLDLATRKNSSVTLYRIEKDKDVISAGSCVELSSEGKVKRFEEKPSVPFSSNYGIPYYFVKSEDISKLKNIPSHLRDNSGQIVAELVRSSSVFGYKYDGEIIHITSERDYQRIIKEEKVELSSLGVKKVL